MKMIRKINTGTRRQPHPKLNPSEIPMLGLPAAGLEPPPPAMGRPHCGHVGAAEETSRPQSGHLINAIKYRGHVIHDNLMVVFVVSWIKAASQPTAS